MALFTTLAALLTLSFSMTVHSVQGCVTDGSVEPNCTQWSDPEKTFYQPHQYNCSRFWQCSPDFKPCLLECPSISEEMGGGSLSFNTELSVCDWPWNVDCTTTSEPTTPATTTPATTTAGTTTGVVCSYVLEKNMRFPSILYDIAGKTTTATATECQHLCDDYEECVAWTWNGNRQSSCYIKSKIIRKRFQLGAVSGRKVCE